MEVAPRRNPLADHEKIGKNWDKNETCCSRKPISFKWEISRLPVDIRLSSRTVRRRLKDDFHLRSFRAAFKSRLSEKIIRDRLNFCNAHNNWTIEMWRKVLLTDETQIKQFSPNIPLMRIQQMRDSIHNTSFLQSKNLLLSWFRDWLAEATEQESSSCFKEKLSTLKLALAFCKKNFVWIDLNQCDFFCARRCAMPQQNAWRTGEGLEHQHIRVLTPWPWSSLDLNPIEGWAQTASIPSPGNFFGKSQSGYFQILVQNYA